MAEKVGYGKYSHPALNGLDRKLEKYLNKDAGFFVEAGANDGFSRVIRIIFEKIRNWTGVLIEPIPDLARRCARRRKNSTVVNAALVSRDFGEPEIEITYAGLMSAARQGFEDDTAANHHFAQALSVQNLDRSYAIKVPAATLTSILDKFALNKRIDLLSLDVEGYEPLALKGLRSKNTVLITFALKCVILRPSKQLWANIIDRLKFYPSATHTVTSCIAERTSISEHAYSLSDFQSTRLHCSGLRDNQSSAAPGSSLIVADGPRVEKQSDIANCKAAREAVDNAIDWPCEVLRNYADNNLGCRHRVSSGLTWAFENVEEAIILEDDCVPDPSFFTFCEDLLRHYRNDTRVMMIWR